MGDIVSIKASQCEASYSAASWFISNSEGMFVLHPDTLISSTAVVGSHFCIRRGVLSEWFRGIDGDSRIMIIGSLVHELLQEVILYPLPSFTYFVLYCGVCVSFFLIYAHKYVNKLNEW
jgi:DNA replication ATP-dependent helicase Dna2